MHDRYYKPSIRHTYWELSKAVKGGYEMLRHPDQTLKSHFRKDFRQYICKTAQPIKGETNLRARAAANWLLLAQTVTADDGVSLGYFPQQGKFNGWHPSYPETTGYIMTSLLHFSKCSNDPSFADAAIRMGKWEVAVQMPSGAVQGGPVTSADLQTPAAFNTGMVLDGWCSAYEATQDQSFLDAARKAADFLAADSEIDGYFRTNGEYVSSGEIKTYTCLCAWAVYRFGQLADEDKYRKSAVENIEAALLQQQDNGWFAHNCLTNSAAPLTHTIGYTLQGIFEVGLLSDRQDFIDAVIKGIEPILEKVQANGFLPGRFYSDWEPATFSSCLTGSAQIAIVCYRLADYTGNLKFQQKADQLVDYLKGLQVLDSRNSALNGAIAGSFPLFGEYMTSGFPNWATKYFLDALMLQNETGV